MKTQLTIPAILFFIFSFTASAQNMEWEWAVNSYGDAAIISDAAGNIYVGETALTKYAPDGTVIWDIVLANQNQVVIIEAMAIDHNGYIYLTGNFRSDRPIPAQLGTYTFSGYGVSDIFTAKLDTSGQVLWVQEAGSPWPQQPPPGPIFAPAETATGVAVDVAGNCYITGYYFNGQELMFGNDSIPLSPAEGGFLAKYDSAGMLQWVRKSPFVIKYGLRGVSVDAQGNSYVTGYDTSGIEVVKYSTSGNLVWRRAAIGHNNDYPNGISTDSLGNSYITGSISDTTNFGNFTLTNIRQPFLVKYDSAGTVQWAVQSSGSGSSWGEAVYADKQGHVYLTGSIDGNTNFAGSNSHISISGNIFAAKFDASTGDAIWAKGAMGQGVSNYGKAVTALPNGDCYITGYYANSATFGNHTIAGYTGFVAKVTESPLAVAGAVAEKAMEIYPNPASSEFIISMPAAPAHISISTESGQQVFSKFTENTQKTLVPISEWPAGMYIVKVVSKNKVVTQKLVVTR